mgnify:CR=1 FL=1
MAAERLHLVGFCGSGMAGLAVMLKQLGHSVSGSDEAAYPPMSDILAAEAIPILPFSPANLADGIDRIVIGAGVPRRNPEFAAAVESRIPMISYPAALARYVIDAGHPAHVVAGTHGKTTTTSMLAWIHDTAGTGAGFFVGGIPRNLGRGARLPHAAAPLIIEGDEYKSSNLDPTPKFLHYRPALAVITNVEFDHGDVFDDLPAVMSAFAGLAARVDAGGAIVTTAGDDVVGAIAASARCRVVTVGREQRHDWRIVEEAYQPQPSFALAASDGQRLGPLRLAIPGRHNVDNAALAAVSARLAGVGAAAIVQALATFAGARQRLEPVAEAGGLRVISDFAHHPSEVAASIAALKQAAPDRRVWAVFEPRSATSKSPRFHDAYRAALGTADRVTIFAVPPLTYARPTLDCHALARAIGGDGTPAAAAADIEAILAELVAEARAGTDVLIMSSGPFGGLAGRLAAMIAADRTATGPA